MVTCEFFGRWYRPYCICPGVSFSNHLSDLACFRLFNGCELSCGWHELELGDCACTHVQRRLSIRFQSKLQHSHSTGIRTVGSGIAVLVSRGERRHVFRVVRRITNKTNLTGCHREQVDIRFCCTKWYVLSDREQYTTLGWEWKEHLRVGVYTYLNW